MTSAEKLKARYPHIVFGESPSLSHQAKASILDYAASASNQLSCYTGHQYIENFHDFRPARDSIIKGAALDSQRLHEALKRVVDEVARVQQALSSQNWQFLAARLSVFQLNVKLKPQSEAT